MTYTYIHPTPHQHHPTHTTLQHHIQSGDILRMLSEEFNVLAMNPNLDLYPADLAAKLEETEGWLHDCVADGQWVGWGGCGGWVGCLYMYASSDHNRRNPYPMTKPGVYRCGLARSQLAYDEAADALCQGLGTCGERGH